MNSSPKFMGVGSTTLGTALGGSIALPVGGTAFHYLKPLLPNAGPVTRQADAFQKNMAGSVKQGMQAFRRSEMKWTVLLMGASMALTSIPTLLKFFPRKNTVTNSVKNGIQAERKEVANDLHKVADKVKPYFS